MRLKEFYTPQDDYERTEEKIERGREQVNQAIHAGVDYFDDLEVFLDQDIVRDPSVLEQMREYFMSRMEDEFGDESYIDYHTKSGQYAPKVNERGRSGKANPEETPVEQTLMSFQEFRKQHPELKNHGRAKRAYKSWAGTQNVDEAKRYNDKDNFRMDQSDYFLETPEEQANIRKEMERRYGPILRIARRRGWTNEGLGVFIFKAHKDTIDEQLDEFIHPFDRPYRDKTPKDRFANKSDEELQALADKLSRAGAPQSGRNAIHKELAKRRGENWVEESSSHLTEYASQVLDLQLEIVRMQRAGKDVPENMYDELRALKKKDQVAKQFGKSALDEGKKKKVKSKERDPAWKDMVAKRQSGAAGPHTEAKYTKADRRNNKLVAKQGVDDE